jgi:hypothetical protein
MAKFLQLSLWNANGLTQHVEELKTFISIHKYSVKQEQLGDFYNNLECRFIAGGTTMPSILTGDPDSLLPEDAKYSKRWKETT